MGNTPVATDKVRIDTGVRQGDEVSQYYDPMIAKLVVWDQSRFTALQALKQKLKEYHIVGLSTNINFLGTLASHPQFENADVHTGFIDEHYDKLFPKKEPLTTYQFAQAALGLLLNEQYKVNTKTKQIEYIHRFVMLNHFK